MAKRVTLKELGESLERLVECVSAESEQVLIECDGKPVAAIVPIHQYESLRRSREWLWEFIERTREANKDVDPAEIDEAVDAAVREVRAARRADKHS